MGGAVFTSLDGEAHFAALPERVESALRGAVDRLSGARKADKLPPVGENTAARHVVRLSMTSRVGSREVVRVRPFVRVSSNLSLSVSDLSANIPPFNPQKLLSEGAADGANPDEPAANAEPDAEVSFVHARADPDGHAHEDRKRDAAGRHPCQRPRSRELDQPQHRQTLRGRHRPARADGLRARRFHARSLSRLRDTHRSRKHHAAAQDREPDHRRQFLERARGQRQEGRQYLDHPARARRDAGRDQGDCRDPRPARTRQRPEGRPAAAHPVVPDCRRRAPAADPRDRRQ